MEIFNYNKILERGVGYNPIGDQYRAQRRNLVPAFSSDSVQSRNWTYFELSENAGKPLRKPCPDLSTFSKTLQVESMVDGESADQNHARSTYRMRLLISTTEPRDSDADEDLFPIPCSQETFERITDIFLLPKSYLETLYRGATIFLQFPPGYSATCLDARGHLYQNTNTRLRNMGAAISFQPKQRIINAFIHGLIQHEIEDLLHRLEQYSTYFSFPSLLPTIFLEMRLDMATRNSRWTFEKIQQIERETGLDPGWQYTLHRLPSDGVDITKIDYPSITHNLTAISARVAHYGYVCKVHNDMPDTLDKMNSEFITSVCQDEERKRFTEIEPFLRARIDHLRLYLKATLARVEHLETRLQCQRDTLFSFVAQRDNLFNSRTANQSLFLANVTFWFLPTTFLATFFSTAFFQFPITSANPPKMSSWIWLYFVISLCITIVVYLVWWHKSTGEGKNTNLQPKTKHGSEDNI